MSVAKTQNCPMRGCFIAASIANSIFKDSVFILGADHGGHDKTHGSNRPDDMTIPWIAWGQAVNPNFEIKIPVSTCDTAATALWLLDVPIPANFDGKPVESAFKPAPEKNIG